MACMGFDGPGCSEILEADVVFNPEFGWTDDFAFANANHYSVIDYGRAVMHELGHVWGMQGRLCGETYAYDRLTVMHGYSPPRIEDSFGIHNGDAWGLRLNYQDQASPFPITDVGVESYFASWGLLNAWVMENEFDAFAPGDPISINGISVENNSGFPVDGVRIRLFLSTNTIISEFDHQMGGYWYFNQPMPGQSEWAGDLTTTVPNVAPGNYHVGIIVTTDGDAWAEDDFPWNNATYLFDRIVVVAPPGNDECGLATTLGSNGLYQVSTHGATTSGPGLPASCGGGTIHDDVWYRFDSSFDGLATVSFCADGYASIDMRMSVHEGNCDGPVVACNDDACSADPEMEFPIACGRTYFVRIGASSADQQGTGVFRFVTQGVCSQCPGDLNGDGVVSGVDLGLWLIEEWRECSPTGPCIGDLDQDGEVGGSDLGVLLAAWGDCP